MEAFGVLLLAFLLGNLALAWFQLSKPPAGTETETRASAEPQEQSCFCHVSDSFPPPPPSRFISDSHFQFLFSPGDGTIEASRLQLLECSPRLF